MEAAYREYLANYSNVTTLENSYKQEEELWNQMVGLIKASAYVRSGWPEPDGAGALTLCSALQAGGQRHVSELLPGDAGAANRSLPAAPADHPEAHAPLPPGLPAAAAGGSHLHRPQLPHQRVQALQRSRCEPVSCRRRPLTSDLWAEAASSSAFS